MAIFYNGVEEYLGSVTAANRSISRYSVLSKCILLCDWFILPLYRCLCEVLWNGRMSDEFEIVW
jgi:hypothetical protein